MERFAEPRKKSNFGMRCMQCILILFNVLYLIISFLMISGATTQKIMFAQYAFGFWRNSTVYSLSSLWIAIGCFLFALSIFGIIAVARESTLMTNVYGLFLSLIFILQIASAITGFTLTAQSDEFVRNSLYEEMSNSYNEPTDAMNWIQTTFECCGNVEPFDWTDHGKWSTTRVYPTDSYESWYYQTTQDEEPSSTTENQLGIKMPQSCCKLGSIYDDTQMICEYEEYFSQGCHGPLQAFVSESSMMFGISALSIGFLQIFGVFCSFSFARTIRRNKSDIEIQKWANHQRMSSDRPAYADQVATQEAHEHEAY